MISVSADQYRGVGDSALPAPHHHFGCPALGAAAAMAVEWAADPSPGSSLLSLRERRKTAAPLPAAARQRTRLPIAMQIMPPPRPPVSRAAENPAAAAGNQEQKRKRLQNPPSLLPSRLIPQTLVRVRSMQRMMQRTGWRKRKGALSSTQNLSIPMRMRDPVGGRSMQRTGQRIRNGTLNSKQNLTTRMRTRRISSLTRMGRMKNTAKRTKMTTTTITMLSLTTMRTLHTAMMRRTRSTAMRMMKMRWRMRMARRCTIQSRGMGRRSSSRVQGTAERKTQTVQGWERTPHVQSASATVNSREHLEPTGSHSLTRSPPS
mmetsp:Transcript_10582/g.31852  ORF Transcript_10582/g.31852 Transcript_10582/m.31852 type:complete len:318 (+) Transcript_10582:441-1394(+)